MADDPEPPAPAQLQTTTATADSPVGPETTAIYKLMKNPRVEIDTSPPFGSVKEAVTHFGGSGSWVPLHVHRLPAGVTRHDEEGFSMDKVEKQAAELEKDLIIKEQETLGVLKELEAAKGIVEGLKLSLIKEVCEFMSSLELSTNSGMSTPNENSTGIISLCNIPSPGSILMDLKEAKLNLNKATNDLSLIQASVESLNKKMRNQKNMLGRGNETQGPLANKEVETRRVFQNSINVSRGLQEFNFEAEQFKRMEEAAQYEVIKATSEIEQTKLSIKMVEMRLVAAKKLEEAARAMEAVSLAEKNGDSSSRLEGITLSYEEYSVLTQKAQKGEELCKNEVGVDSALHQLNKANLPRMTFLKGYDERTEDDCCKTTLEQALGPKVDGSNRRNINADNGLFRERSGHGQIQCLAPNYPKNRKLHSSHSHARRGFEPLVDDEGNLFKDKPMPALRSSVSIGDILNRKLIVQDDIMAGKHVESQNVREEVSLSQMLREQSGLIFRDPRKAVKDENVDKQFITTTRKKFGFIHVTLPLTRQSKKKTQPLNMR